MINDPKLRSLFVPGAGMANEAAGTTLANDPAKLTSGALSSLAGHSAGDKAPALSDDDLALIIVTIATALTEPKTGVDILLNALDILEARKAN